MKKTHREALAEFCRRNPKDPKCIRVGGSIAQLLAGGGGGGAGFAREGREEQATPQEEQKGATDPTIIPPAGKSEKDKEDKQVEDDEKIDIAKSEQRGEQLGPKDEPQGIKEEPDPEPEGLPGADAELDEGELAEPQLRDEEEPREFGTPRGEVPAEPAIESAPAKPLYEPKTITGPEGASRPVNPTVSARMSNANRLAERAPAVPESQGPATATSTEPTAIRPKMPEKPSVPIQRGLRARIPGDTGPAGSLGEQATYNDLRVLTAERFERVRIPLGSRATLQEAERVGITGQSSRGAIYQGGSSRYTLRGSGNVSDAPVFQETAGYPSMYPQPGTAPATFEAGLGEDVAGATFGEAVAELAPLAEVL